MRRDPKLPQWSRLSSVRHHQMAEARKRIDNHASQQAWIKETAVASRIQAERAALQVRAAAACAAAAKSDARRRLEATKLSDHARTETHRQAAIEEAVRQACNEEDIANRCKAACAEAEVVAPSDSSAAAAKLHVRAIVRQTRRVPNGDLSRAASTAFSIACRKATAHEKNQALIAQWDEEENRPAMASLGAAVRMDMFTFRRIIVGDLFRHRCCEFISRAARGR